MPPSILRWAFHSPARLAAVCLVVAGIVVGGVVLARSQTVARTPPVPRSSAQPVAQPDAGVSRPAAPPAEPVASPSERVPPSVRTGIETSARAFVDAWARDARPTSRARWLRGIEPLTTRSLYRGLRVTDPARLPRGHVRRVAVQEDGSFAGRAVVALSGGLRVEVLLVTDHDHWLVADIRPAGP